MEKIVKGYYRSSFSTTELESKNRDISYRKISIEGRRTLINTIEIPEYPVDCNYLKMNIDTIQDVEIYVSDDAIIPFNTDLYQVKWINIRISSEQEIDGVLHGILEAEIFAKYNREKKEKDKTELKIVPETQTTEVYETNSFENIHLEEPATPIIEPTILAQNKGCFNAPKVGCLPMLKNGCLSSLLWLFLILLLLGLFRKCASNDFEKINKSDVTETNPLDTLKLKQEGKDSLNYDETDNRIETIKTVSLPNVQFFTNSDQLLPTSKQDLDGLAKYLLENLNAEADIIGHTDNVGGLQKNMKLSYDRANTVKNYLIEKGIDGNRMQAIGLGPTEPRASNDTPEGRLMNRRVEVKISQQSRN